MLTEKGPVMPACVDLSHYHILGMAVQLGWFCPVLLRLPVQALNTSRHANSCLLPRGGQRFHVVRATSQRNTSQDLQI
jgi:hypothetical protein